MAGRASVLVDIACLIILPLSCVLPAARLEKKVFE